MYQVYLDGDQIPVAPAKIETKVENQNTTVNLISGDKVNILKSPGLTDIAFDLLLPHTKYPFGGGGSVSTWLDRLQELKDSRKPFRLIIVRDNLGFDTNLQVSLEDYTSKEDAKSQGRDLVASLKLRQYRLYGTKTVTLVQETVATTPVAQRDTGAKETPSSHTVVKGDTLWTICKKYLGDPTKCWEIAKLNGISNPNHIEPGWVIRFG